MIAGGCRCSAVRYQLAEVRDAGLCHCPACRRTTGSAFAAWAEVATDGLTVERGAPRVFEDRAFCGECGTPLWHTGPDWRRVNVGTLDDPSAVPPRIHLAAHQQIPWLRLADMLPWTEELEATPVAARKVYQGPADPSVTRAAALSLRDIDKAQQREVLLLDVHGHQRRMVGSNAFSLAQAIHAPRSWARAICAGDVAVGFVLMDVIDEAVQGLPTLDEPYVWRFLIDRRYQRLGFGARAIELIAAAAKARDTTGHTARALWLSCVPGSAGPYRFYRRLGFEDTGVIDDGEVFLKRDYPAPAP